MVHRPGQTIQLENEISGYNEEEIKQRFESSGGRWIEVKDYDFVSYDGSHLHYESAEKLSEIIGEYISKDLDN